MSDIHIDDFYKDTGKILVQLYRSFPRKDLLLAEDISGVDTPDEYGLHSERHQSCFGAAIWLAESGYIQYGETIRQEGMDQVTLTHKAFTLLAAKTTFASEVQEVHGDLPPSVLEQQLSNIQQLRDALRSGSSNRIKQIVQYLLSQSKHH